MIEKNGIREFDRLSNREESQAKFIPCNPQNPIPASFFCFCFRFCFCRPWARIPRMTTRKPYRRFVPSPEAGIDRRQEFPMPDACAAEGGVFGRQVAESQVLQCGGHGEHEVHGIAGIAWAFDADPVRRQQYAADVGLEVAPRVLDPLCRVGVVAHGAAEVERREILVRVEVRAIRPSSSACTRSAYC